METLHFKKIENQNIDPVKETPGNIKEFEVQPLSIKETIIMSKGDVRQLVWFGLKPFYFEDIMSILYILDLQMLHFPFLSHLLNLNVFCIL